jgi:predicted nucleic acid-binding protein
MYLDSCIIVKLLAPEPDSGFLDRELSGQALTTSELAFTEVFAALLAKERAGAFGEAERQMAWRQFRAWIEAEEILLEPLNSAVLRKAVRILELCHPQLALRTLDAIHLATADICMDTPVCSTDRRLRDAALKFGLEVFPAA